MTNRDEEMVERVARAICISLGHDPDASTSPRMRPGDTVQLDVAIPAWRNYRAEARAAIAALPRRDAMRVRAALEGLLRVAHGRWFADDGTDSNEEREAIREARAALTEEPGDGANTSTKET